MEQNEFLDCASPEYNQDYSPIKFPRNNSVNELDIPPPILPSFSEKFKLKLRHTSTLPIYEKEEEQKHEKPLLKNKKQLKLVTNACLDEMEKSKSFSPQPSRTSALKIYSNFFTFLPTKSLKRKNSLPTTDDYHYFEEFFDITTRKGSLKQQQDKVFFIINKKKLLSKNINKVYCTL